MLPSPKRDQSRQPLTPAAGRLFLMVAFCLLPFLLAAAPAQDGPPPITYQRYDVTIKVQGDGSFIVREIQQVRFDGEFRTAFAEIPTELTESIKNVQVYELSGETQVQYRPRSSSPAGEDDPGAFSTTQEGNSLYVDWAYEPTQPGDVRTFIVEYQVFGGLWIYAEGDILEWRAIPADRSGVPVEASRVTVTLPQPLPVDTLQATAYGPDFQINYGLSGAEAPPGETGSAIQVIYDVAGPIPDGERFQIQMGFPHGLVDATPSFWQIREDAAELQVSLPALVTELHVEEDGNLLVEEYHTVVVEAGALYASSRAIPTRFLDSIQNIEVYEGEQQFVESRANCEYCLRVDHTERGRNWVTYDRETYALRFDPRAFGAVDLSWTYPPLVQGEESTFLLRYRVSGAVQVLEDGQRIIWTAIYPDRQEPIDSATFYLYPPPGLTVEDLRVTGGRVDVQPNGAAQIVYNGVVPAGQSWEITVDMPAGATNAVTPRWQQEVAQVAAAVEAAAVADARLRLGVGATSVLLLVLGVAALIGIWYTWGRDKPLPEVADYLPEPPSDLPPGIVAYLLDEQPTPKGALAGLFHLAALGFLELDLENGLSVRRVEEPPTAPDALPDHLRKLLSSLEPALEPGQEVPFAKIEHRFMQALPSFYAEMSEEVAPYFDALPGQSRHRWLVWGQWGVIGAVILALLLALNYTERIGWLALGPALSLLAVGLGAMLISRWMPRRTDTGVEEAQRWRAFKRYLSNLKRYAGVEDAQKILDRYFAYAVALDVEEVVLQSAAEMGTRVPTWTFGPTWRRTISPRPRPSTQGQPYPASGAPAEVPDLSLPERPVLTLPTSRSIGATLNQASRSLGARLTQNSEKLGQVLTTAAGGAAVTPFGTVQKGTASTLDVLGEILKEASSGGGGGSHRGGRSSHSSSWGSSRASSSSRSSSRSSSSRRSSFSSSGRSSSSRRSGGGGRRGFGR